MDTKTIILSLIKENKRYWGKLLYQEYFDLFQKIHSNQFLADLISKDLGFTFTEKQMENLKKRYHTNVASIPVSNSSQVLKEIPSEQNLYDQIYGKTKKSDFDLNNM
ncbi:MAG: hypothetical protein ACOVOQ_03895 [Flavobacterium sp.]